MYFWFVAYRFLKPTLIILAGLLFFFVSIDSLQYIDSMPSATNLLVLFLAYDAAHALNYVLPLSLILGLIVFYISLVKSNQYIALLSLGYSKKKIFFVPLCFIILITCAYVGMNATPLAYAEENAMNTAQGGRTNVVSRDLFIRYGNDYIFFSKIYPLLQKAENIRIYQTLQEGNRVLTKIVEANEGYFENNAWNLVNPTIAYLPSEYVLGGTGLRIEHKDELITLHGFKPKILDTIYKNKPSISIMDAISSLKILINENSNTNRVRGVLYTLIAVPFFVPMLACVVAYYMPPLSRYGNITLTSIGLSVLALITWGIFFSLGKLQANLIFIPEIGILTPLLILFITSCFYYRKMNRI